MLVLGSVIDVIVADFYHSLLYVLYVSMADTFLDFKEKNGPQSSNVLTMCTFCVINHQTILILSNLVQDAKCYV